MISITVGLGLVLIGLFFGNLWVSALGILCFAAGARTTKSRPMPAAEAKPRKHTVIMSEPPETTIQPWETPTFPVSAAYPNDAENALNRAIRGLKAEEKKAKTPAEKKEARDAIAELEDEKAAWKKSNTGISFLPLPEYGYTDPLERIFVGLPIKFLRKV